MTLSTLDPLDPLMALVHSAIYEWGSWYTVLIWSLAAWIVLEIGFFIALRFYIWPNLRSLNRPAPYHHTSGPIKCVFRIFQHIDLVPGYDFNAFVSGFFREAKLEDIRLDNVRSFLSWVMYSEFYPNLSSEDREDIETVISEMGRRYGYYPAKGFNPDVKHVAMTLEPVPYLHRPLLAYVGNGIAELIFQYAYLRMRGFNQFQFGRMTYWIRQGPTIETPLLVLHGITNGWITYGYLLHTLLSPSSPARTIILVDVEAIKIKSLRFDMLSPDEFPECIAGVLNRHGIPKVSIMGHSFGSITAGWVALCRPDLVAHLTLVDPVSLLLGLPEVAYNFLYRPPTNLIEGFILYGASREITISHMLHRHFWWHRNILYLEDVPHHIGVVVALSSHDPILNAPAVLHYTNYCNDVRMKLIQQQQRSTSSKSDRVLRSMTRTRQQAPLINNGEDSETLMRSTSCSSIASLTSTDEIQVDAIATSCSNATSVRPIVPVYWDGYTHGQFLMCSEALPQLLTAMYKSEGIHKVKII